MLAGVRVLEATAEAYERSAALAFAERLLVETLPDAGAPLPEQRRSLYVLGASTYRDLVRLAFALGRAELAAAQACLALAEGWRPPAFPLRGDDLLALGVEPGPELGRLLAAVRGEWLASDFALDRDACLHRLRELVAAPSTRA